MSRTFISGAGLDVTSTVITFLKSAAARQLLKAHLILIGELEDPTVLFLTDWESDLTWPVYGTFRSSDVELKDKVSSEVGLTVANLNLRWSPLPGAFTNNIATTSPYQLAQLGFYDNKRVRIWRTVMPTAGDAATYGACEWFGGWIADATVYRASINFQVNSFLNVINEKLPPNVIENTNVLAGFVAGTPVLADGETSVPTFMVVAPSGAQIILGQTLQPTAGKIYSNDKFDQGYIVFLNGALKGRYSTVAVSSNFNAGGGVHYNQFQLYAPFPFDPAPGDTFYVAMQPPMISGDPVGGVYGNRSFIYVPDPEVGST